jgi:exodeoxyribonuclease-3
MHYSIFSWNVNGIRAVMRKGAIQSFIQTCSPDIVCLQEIKAEKQELPIDFAEYEECWNPATRKGYAGTAIFSKTKPLLVVHNLLDHIARKFKLVHDGYGHPNEEGRIIMAEYPEFFCRELLHTKRERRSVPYPPQARSVGPCLSGILQGAGEDETCRVLW